MSAPTDSFGRPLPPEAIAVSRLMPPRDREVLLFVEDLGVAIKGTPVVGWNSGSAGAPHWWVGLPGNYVALREHRWSVSHWMPLPWDSETRDRKDKALNTPAKPEAPQPPKHASDHQT